MFSQQDPRSYTVFHHGSTLRHFDHGLNYSDGQQLLQRSAAKGIYRHGEI